MGCNCGGGAAGVFTGGSDEMPNYDTFQQQGECTEGYLARAGNPSGDMEGGPAEKNKIANASMVVNCNLQLDQQLQLGDGSDPVAAWSIEPMDPAFKLDSKTGRFTATFPDPGAGKSKTYSITVTAKRADGSVIDSKPYTFAAEKCGSMSVKFNHPLPGSRVTSIFTGNSPRQDIPRNKPHRGIDLSYGAGIQKDVLASADGYVVRSGEMTGAGNGIVMHHKNAQGVVVATTKYFHLAKIYASTNPNKLIPAGTPIGLEGGSGANGPSTYPVHLHFEVWKGADGQPVDPEDYISGELRFKQGVRPNNPNGKTTNSNGEIVKKNDNTEMTDGNAQATCSGYQTDPSDPDAANADPTHGVKPSQQEVINRIKAVLAKHPELDAEDQKFFLTTARIESNFNPYASNNVSSAVGLYQFLAKLAHAYGMTTMAQRTNVEISTEAMIKFYKNEILRYYDGWVSSRKEKDSWNKYS